ncbi:pyridoxal-phosphate dependent enzyme [Flammeovirgaceae bacterium SG7u.111]|nr:pyridoxal-phosphate dependent enzyme [Flammeovirgaceae bacterium SG7u.132]WPO34268.1 pyridoxal-phosphate dependent enzyme [Flammeovirgaceae bacterium SG7u.111]
MQNQPTLADIRATHDRIRPYIHQTPVLTSSSINQIAGMELYFKCENLQKVGAFKIRGGINAVSLLMENEKPKAVATHSSGNHAQAVALAAQLFGTKAYIVMPTSAPEVKKKAVEGYGATVIPCEPTLQAREDTLAKVVEETGAIFIPPFNDYNIITGQATAAVELLEEISGLEAIIAPVGGGGLMAGTALATHYLSPTTTVLAGEPLGADDAYHSLKKGEITPRAEKPNTIADGLLTTVGELNFPIIKELVSEIITVTDEEIIAAMKLIWERMKQVVEPSGAVPFAAMLKEKEKWQGKKVGVIFTGGNVDLGKLPF